MSFLSCSPGSMKQGHEHYADVTGRKQGIKNVQQHSMNSDEQCKVYLLKM